MSMRDIINLIDYIAEDRTLSAGVIKKYKWRFDKFIDMIRNGESFYDTNKDEVTIHPDEADRLQAMYDDGKFTGTIRVRLGTNEEIPLSKLLKTAELGGQASKGGEEETGKEAALLKPSQIGITDKDIPATELGEAIITNSVLQSTDYGQIVIGMAKTIMDGGNPTIPAEVPTKIRDSIIDYAGEYLGVLALVMGTSRFPRRKGFEEWLGASVSDLVLFFPGKANVPLADSFARIKNAKTKHQENKKNGKRE